MRRLVLKLPRVLQVEDGDAILFRGGTSSFLQSRAVVYLGLESPPHARIWASVDSDQLLSKPAQMLHAGKPSLSSDQHLVSTLIWPIMSTANTSTWGRGIFQILLASNFPTIGSIPLIRLDEELPPIFLMFRITRNKDEYDVQEIGLCTIGRLKFPSDTRRYYVAVTPRGTELRIKIPKERFIEVGVVHHTIHPDRLFQKSAGY